LSVHAVPAATGRVSHDTSCVLQNHSWQIGGGGGTPGQEIAAPAALDSSGAPPTGAVQPHAARHEAANTH
jgi:hypothetical protein